MVIVDERALQARAESKAVLRGAEAPLFHSALVSGRSAEIPCINNRNQEPISGFSPRNTREIPRTIRRNGSAPLLSAKKISPIRLLR